MLHVKVYGNTVKMQSSTLGKNQTAYQHNRLLPAFKYGGANVMIQTFLAATVTFEAEQQLKLFWNRIKQQDNDPKHSNKSTTAVIRKIIKVLQQLSQSPALNPIEKLCRDLKENCECLQISMNWSTNLKWPKMSLQQCEGGIMPYRKQLLPVCAV